MLKIHPIKRKCYPPNQYPMNQLKMDILIRGFVGQEKLTCYLPGKVKSSCGPRQVQWRFLGAGMAGVGLLFWYGPAALDWHWVLFRMSFLPLMPQSSSVFQEESHLITHQRFLKLWNRAKSKGKPKSPNAHSIFYPTDILCEWTDEFL